MAQSSLIGSILERKPAAKPSSPSQATTKTGFPAVQHRSQSAFARARRDGSKPGTERLRDVPIVQSSGVRSSVPPLPHKPSSGSSKADDWRSQMEEDNRRQVASMTEEERDQERAEILGKFGSNVVDVLRKARAAREGKLVAGGSETPEVGSLIRPSSPQSTSAGSTRPPSRAERKIRFADLTAGDIHVYESAPPSPRKKALALPAPSDGDGPTVSLGQWRDKNSMTALRPSEDAQDDRIDEAHDTKVGNLEEGTPEDIRRRFFPAAPAHDPSLAWMRDDAEQDAEPEAEPNVRFDLTGNPIPPQLASKLPTHLGLHHHAEGSHAGYTLEDIFLLSRSTVPAQRASMIGLLAKIAHKLARTSADNKKGLPELAGQELTLRKRMLATGVEAMGERGGVGARAVELLWECTVSWDEGVQLFDGVELYDLDLGSSAASSEGAISSLPLDYMLPQVANMFATADLPSESMVQLLEVLHRVAQHSNSNAVEIVSTKGLVANTFQTFLLTPIPPTAGSPLPKPFALTFLRTLALASRENASVLVGPADSLLRFIVTIPSASPFPPTLATTLLTETLRLYVALGSYGLYAHIATTAQEHFLQINRYILSPDCQSKDLRLAWLQLLETWIMCAQDPHRTTPSHEILWSQVVGWRWAEDILALRQQLTDQSLEIWGRIWNAEAAFLEGARINGAKGGEDERAAVLASVKDAFSNGVERRVMNTAVKGARDALGKLSSGLRQSIVPADLHDLRKIGRHATVLAAAIRLFLACTPHSTSEPLPEPPFTLPFAELSHICATATNHPLWTGLYTPETVPYTHALCRPLSNLLSYYLRLSKSIPDNSPALWMAQAFAILCRLFPGDEECAQRAVNDITDTVTADFLQARGWSVPSEVWDKGGMTVVAPFLAHTLRPRTAVNVGPVCVTPRSISIATTQRLPPLSSLMPNEKRELRMPVTKDWLFSPLDHLLRSGETSVFKHLPDSWDASEADIVRATLLLARVSQEVLGFHNLGGFLMSREEVAFGCMKVFMLEHGQQQDDSQEEVFRDNIVERFMTDLLAPFSASASAKSLHTPPPSIHSADSIDVVAKRFLGSAVPFYQWYTDFVGLYDAISFAHPLFARLLLPPLSMRYPVDYRKYLWADYSHVMRTIRTPPEAVVTGSIAEYLWPVETDAEVVGAYLRALVKGGLEGFVRLVAVHHVACRIWPDLGSDGEERTQKLLQAVVDQGGIEAVRDVVLYRQNRQGTIMLPPACFEQPGEWKTARLEFAGKCGAALGERLKNLLESE
ncbi:RNA polymerase II-associated protein 1 [Trametes pubescens]|uniref:RNA polymerase II-associated protein 1 n=1 Tax=Trametes pubescens TaxID=154538 RepID=A0A1M2V9Z0_TRAPU|nr:RNA polymerase II-associated protein 1 [Trametes pubescens]